ncbi:MAG: tetratricopeptide repeat protein [Bacteroidetes bacterium]|nr:tetratricopeptide repeat protein [Bacteroidota bacterium]
MKLFSTSFLIILFSSGSIITSFGQSSSSIDSLGQKLNTLPEDTSKVNALNDIAFKLRNNKPDQAFQYASQALAIAEKHHYTYGIADALKIMGTTQHYKGNYGEAIGYFLKSLKIFEELCKTSSNEKSIRAAKKGMASVYNNMGLVYYAQNNNEKAIENYANAMNLKEELGDKAGVASTLSNLGLMYYDMKQYEKAIEYINKALKIHKEFGNQMGVAASYSLLGDVYDVMENFETAMKYFLDALAIHEKLEVKYGIAANLTSIGVAQIHLKKYHEAIETLNNAFDLSKEMGSKEGTSECYQGLSRAYFNLNDFKRAYEYHKLYSETKDSLLNEESSRQIAEMQTKYETEKKEQQIHLLNKEGELQKSEVRRQKIIIWSVVSGLLIVVVLSLFIIKERRKSEKLLLNILPAETAKELKANGKAKAKQYEQVTVMFTDFKGFTTIAEKLSAEELVSELDFLFKKFDEIIYKYPIEKIKTIGDAYMCAGGLPTANNTNAMDVVKAAMEIQEFMQNGLQSTVYGLQLKDNRKQETVDWKLRIGIHTGPVTAGVVGDKKFAYDIWGDTVNTASRMESSGEAGKINISGATYLALKESPLLPLLKGESASGGFAFTHRGKIPAKNKGEIEMYFVEQIV